MPEFAGFFAKRKSQKAAPVGRSLGETPSLNTKDTEKTGRKREISKSEAILVGWVEDARAIPTFKPKFHKVLNQTSAAHFEVGKLLRNTDALKKALATIHQMGDGATLKELMQMYEHAGKPNLINREISITNLELYWIVMNPDFLAKTTFYESRNPISQERVTDFLKEITLVHKP